MPNKKDRIYIVPGDDAPGDFSNAVEHERCPDCDEFTPVAELIFCPDGDRVCDGCNGDRNDVNA